MNKIDKFYEVKNLLQCPRCGRKIRFHAGGLVCKKEHRFDISAKGYVNLLQETKNLKGYDSAFFESRFRFFQGGYYSHILEAVAEQVEKAAAVRLSESPDEPFVLVDAGCGEGYYAASLSQRLGENLQVIAFDISADAVKIAAKNSAPVKWMVADITNIPVKDQSADCILDVFTPANYKEFVRILKPGGTVVKVVPGPNHMGQLRRAAASLLRNKAYSNEEVLDYFEQHFEMEERCFVSRTLELGREDLTDLVRMTPLLFDVDKNKLQLDDITEITVEAEALVGKRR